MKTIGTLKAALDTDIAAPQHHRFDVHDLGPFDHNRNVVTAVNDIGQCVGVSLNCQNGRIEAFREEDRCRQFLGTLGGSFSVARSINNQGEVVGGSLTEGDENFHAFIYRNNQLEDLNEYLNPGSGWELIQAIAINNFGEIIAIGSYAGEDRILRLRLRDMP